MTKPIDRYTSRDDLVQRAIRAFAVLCRNRGWIYCQPNGGTSQAFEHGGKGYVYLDASGDGHFFAVNELRNGNERLKYIENPPVEVRQLFKQSDE